MSAAPPTTEQRPTESVRRIPRYRPRAARRNIGTVERLVCVGTGVGLILRGLRRRSLGGLFVSFLGGGLLLRGVSGHSRIYEQLGIDTTTPIDIAIGVRTGHGLRTEKTISINRPPDELYRYWRNLENLPQIMDHLIEVRSTGDGRSHWVARGPWGTTLEWDAEVTLERENELIAWRSYPGGDVDTTGSVRFQREPEGRGTTLTVTIKYDPPGGKIGARLANFLGQGLEQELQEDLRHFKQMMEAGEIPTTEGQPSGRAEQARTPVPEPSRPNVPKVRG